MIMISNSQQLCMKDGSLSFGCVPKEEEESEEVRQQISEITTYIKNDIDLPLKKKFLDSLTTEEPYQRCCLFFNDNKKYRQIHQLVRVFESLAKNIKSEKYVFGKEKQITYFNTTRELIEWFKNNHKMPGAIVYRNNVKIDPLDKLVAETKKIITNIVSPQYCLCCCCSKNSVNVKE